MHFPILSTLIFLPIVAAILLLFVKTKCTRAYWIYGLFISFVNLGLSCFLLYKFNKSIAGFQFTEIFRIFTGRDIKYFVGIDGISLLMILLTTFLTPICLAISIFSIEKRVKEYVIAFLLIEAFVIGSFCALDFTFLLHFFRSNVDSDVFSNRHLGRRKQNLRGLQIFPLHSFWFSFISDFNHMYLSLHRHN